MILGQIKLFVLTKTGALIVDLRFGGAIKYEYYFYKL